MYFLVMINLRGMLPTLQAGSSLSRPIHDHFKSAGAVVHYSTSSTKHGCRRAMVTLDQGSDVCLTILWYLGIALNMKLSFYIKLSPEGDGKKTEQNKSDFGKQHLPSLLANTAKNWLT